MTEFTGGDWDGLDAAALSAIETDMFDSVHADLPDPIEGADAPDLTFGDTEISGGSAVDAVPEDELIVASDGTAYEGYADFVAGTDHSNR